MPRRDDGEGDDGGGEHRAADQRNDLPDDRQRERDVGQDDRFRELGQRSVAHGRRSSIAGRCIQTGSRTPAPGLSSRVPQPVRLEGRAHYQLDAGLVLLAGGVDPADGGSSRSGWCGASAARREAESVTDFPSTVTSTSPICTPASLAPVLSWTLHDERPFGDRRTLTVEVFDLDAEEGAVADVDLVGLGRPNGSG